MYSLKDGLIFYSLVEEKSFPMYAGKHRSHKQDKLINVTLILKSKRHKIQTTIHLKEQ